ncbi:MAG: thiosulfate oxidation carrier complex protein SoxZ [Betaproteobacteria bacterium]
MSPELLSRIQAPATVRRGEVFAVRVTLAHPMETGYRYDESGRQTPYNVINTFSCTYNGTPAFSASLSSGIAANPNFQFFIRARDSGELLFEWQDDEGRQGRARHALSVAG